MMSRKINHVRKKQNNKDRLETTCQEVPVGLKLGQLAASSQALQSNTEDVKIPK